MSQPQDPTLRSDYVLVYNAYGVAGSALTLCLVALVRRRVPPSAAPSAAVYRRAA